MPKKKAYVKVGKKGWEAVIPRPPKNATHARMACVDSLAVDTTPKVATLPIQDFGCFKGVSGKFSYVRMNKQRKILEEYSGQWHWDGSGVMGIESLTSV